MNLNLKRCFILFSQLILAVTGFFALASCSQVTPELTQSDYSVIFDYSDDNALPTARLSVFMSSVSDVRRYDKIRITSLETGYIWETDSIAVMENEGVQWAGLTNLVAPEDEKLPCGKYEVTYFNADEKECTLNLEINYDIDFYDILFSALPQIMEEKKGIEKIAVYDKGHILIYFGDRTQEFYTARGIWNAYREAGTYQVIWYTKDGNVMCIGPEVPVTPESDQN